MTKRPKPGPGESENAENRMPKTLPLPEVVSESTILRCGVFEIRSSLIRENDTEYEREIVVHKGSAVIIPVFDDGTVLLIEQYRHAAGDYLLELPAGSIEDGETAQECAARELVEETGYEAGVLNSLAEFYVSPGFLTEKMYLFLARGLSKRVADPDEDEFIRVLRTPLGNAAEMVASNRFRDAKTMIGILLARQAAAIPAGPVD